MRFFAEELFIEKFRKIQNQSIKFGRNITVISGQNGVGKSNLLALIASTFGITNKKYTGGNFQPEFTDFFKIPCTENYENYITHIKIVNSENENIISKKHSYKNDSKENRGIRVIPRTSNYFYKEGTTQKKVESIQKEIFNLGAAARINIPTVVSTLSRLYPIGETDLTNKNITKKKHISEIGRKYVEWYNFVIPNSIKNNSASLINKKINGKQRIYLTLDSTSEETQSVGQDNLGSIISNLTEFYYLKLEMGESYNGGIFCIDEIDSSLHPSAQVKLFNLLKKVGEELKLQIFITTHSLTIIKQIINLENSDSKSYKLVYLIDSEKPRIHKYRDYYELKSDLFDELTAFSPRIKVYCEDDLATFILNELIITSKDLNIKATIPHFDLIPISLGCEQLKKLPELDNHFSNVITILDGDAKNKNKKFLLDQYIIKGNAVETGIVPQKLNDNFVFLPSILAPESYLYYIIYSIVNDVRYQSFWDNIGNTDWSIITIPKLKNLFNFDNYTEFKSNDDVKKLFKEINDKGINLKKFINETQIFNFYYKNNIEELEKFIHKFIESIKYVSKKKKSTNY